MNPRGAIIIILMMCVVAFHMLHIPITTTDQVLGFYFVLIGMTDLYLNQIHSRFIATNKK